MVARRRYGLGQSETDASTLYTLPTPLPPMQPGYIQQTVQDGTVITSRITFLGEASGDPSAPGSVMPGTVNTPASASDTATPCMFGTGQFAQLLCSQNFWLLVAASVGIGLLVGGRR